MAMAPGRSRDAGAEIRRSRNTIGRRALPSTGRWPDVLDAKAGGVFGA